MRNAVRCWQFRKAPPHVRSLFLGRCRPRASDWVLEVSDSVSLPVEVTNSVRATACHSRLKSGRRLVLVPGRVPCWSVSDSVR
jgi:hypothetical protein